MINDLSGFRRERRKAYGHTSTILGGCRSRRL